MEKHFKINRMFRKYFFIVLAVVLLFTCKESEKVALNIPFSSKEIKVDGVIESKEWKHGTLVNKLIAPWDDSCSNTTEFYAFVSNNYFNFGFNVPDDRVITIPFKEELDVASEDRVEMFFSKDKSIEKYYCIEIDPTGNILDYSVRFYRDFDESWGFSETSIKAKITDSGYVVEGRILLKELQNIGIVDQFYFGIFRADFKSHREDDVCWHSWIKPNSLDPDFHIPSAFALTSIAKKQ